MALQATVHKTIVIVTHDIDEAIKLADRVAIMNVGGHLEQFATPDELLDAPANEFVASFLGRERGLRRLALRTVADVTPIVGPAVSPGAAPSDAIGVMEQFGTTWVAVVEAEELYGWLSREAVEAALDSGGALRVHGRRPAHPSVQFTGVADDSAA